MWVFIFQMKTKYLALVNKVWLTPLKCETFWPPYESDAQYSRALKELELPKEGIWKICPITKCYFECNIQSQSDNEDLANPPRKRLRRPHLRLAESPSSDESSGQNRNEIRQNQTFRPRPPKISPVLAQSQGQDSSISVSQQNNLSHSFLSRDTTNQPSCSSINDNSCQRNETPTQRNIQNEESGIGLDKKILSTLIYIREQNNQILSWIKKQSKTERFGLALPDDMPINFPLQNIDYVTVIENYMENKDHLNSLCSYFCNVGGRDLSSQINNILKSMVTDNVANKYSFYGKRAEKRAFADLRLKTVVSGAINKTSVQGTEK